MKNGEVCAIAGRLAACWPTALVLVLTATPSLAQHPLAASQQARPAGRVDQASAGEKVAQAPKPAGDSSGKTPASLEEVAKRISTVLAEQGGRGSVTANPPAGSATAASGARPAGRRGAGTTARRPTASRPVSLVTLRWDPALAAGGVSLSWDRQFDPRRAARNQGVRLVWPDAAAIR